MIKSIFLLCEISASLREPKDKVAQRG